MTTSKMTGNRLVPAPGSREAELGLVERCRRGELGAFEDLYRAHAGRLYSLAVRMLGNQADAGGHRLADRAINRIDLERALAELPEGCRAAFVLHDVEGLEHGEVAEVLGIAEGTSKSQVHKARLRLRGLLRQRKVTSSQ